MKTAQINVFGGPDVLVHVQSELCPVGKGEVKVRVAVASVNPLDLKMMAGYMQQVFPVELPYTPGTDFSGVIEEVGHDAGLQVGDRVMGRTSPSAGGAFGAALVIASSELCVIPASMSFEQAAALPTAFGTARQALFDAGQLQAAQRVMIHAGAGGVGAMAVQQAHNAGAYVIATASAKNMGLVKSLGADEVIDYRTQDFSTLTDIDLVLDTQGGETLEKSWSVLRRGGTIATLVDFAIQPKDGYSGHFVFFSTATPYLHEAVDQFEQGKLQVITDSIFSIEDARSALEKVATGHARGKVLIRMSA